jgi:quercetin dioxygenase-like cupin family protein
MKSYDLSKALSPEQNDYARSTVDGDRTGHFWDLAPFEGGGSWIGKWQGESPWERHARGDEFIHVLKGHVDVALITADGKKIVSVPEGHIFVVPKNHWHKQIAREEAIVLGATPGITDHSDSEPPY